MDSDGDPSYRTILSPSCRRDELAAHAEFTIIADNNAEATGGSTGSGATRATGVPSAMWLTRPLRPKVADTSAHHTPSQVPVTHDSQAGAGGRPQGSSAMSLRSHAFAGVHPKPPSDTSSWASDPVGIRIVSPTPPASVSSWQRHLADADPSPLADTSKQFKSEVPLSYTLLDSRPIPQLRPRSLLHQLDEELSRLQRLGITLLRFLRQTDPLVNLCLRHPLASPLCLKISPVQCPFIRDTQSCLPMQSPLSAILSLGPRPALPRIVWQSSEAYGQDYAVEPTPYGDFRVINGPTSILPPHVLETALIFNGIEYPNGYASAVTCIVFGPLQWKIRDQFGIERAGEAKASPATNHNMQSELFCIYSIYLNSQSTRSMAIGVHTEPLAPPLPSDGTSVWNEMVVSGRCYGDACALHEGTINLPGGAFARTLTNTEKRACDLMISLGPTLETKYKAVVSMTSANVWMPISGSTALVSKKRPPFQGANAEADIQAPASALQSNILPPSSVELRPPTGGPPANTLSSNLSPSNPVPANNASVIFPATPLDVNPIPTPFSSVPLGPVGLSAPPQPLSSGLIPSPNAAPPAPAVNVNSLETAPQAITSPQLSAPQDIGSRSPPREFGRTSDTTHAAPHIVVLVAPPPPWFYPHWIIYPHASPYVQPIYPPAYYNPFSGNFMFNGVEGGRSMSIFAARRVARIRA
ncbi:hypothetical protein NMY22_g19120 [Coprinellus aureogranulatus]|nr:hypothetical protein NMY22_g19120 [Coprinellus aureogranulatus]